MNEQRQISELRDRKEHVEELIDEARTDWERKKQDPSIPGAGGGQESDMEGETATTSYPGKSASDSAEPADDQVGPDAMPESAAEADRTADEAAED